MSPPIVAAPALYFTCRGVRAVAGINDSPLLRRHRGPGFHAQVPLDLWLMPDDNRLTLSVEPLEQSSDAPLCEVGVGDADGVDEPLCRLRFTLPVGTRFEPIALALPFATRAPVRTRLFREAKRLAPLSGDKRRALQTFGLHLHRAFAARDLTQVMALCRYRLADTALAFGNDEDELHEQAREQYAAWFAQPGFRLAPVTQSSIAVTPCCDGRVFLLTGPEEQDLIYAPSGSEAPATSLAVYMALTDSGWQWVRA